MIILLVGTYALLSSKLVRSRSTWCRIHLWPLVVPSLQLRMLQPRSLGDFKSRSPSDSVSNLYLENVIKKVKIVFFHTWFMIVTNCVPTTCMSHAHHTLIEKAWSRNTLLSQRTGEWCHGWFPLHIYCSSAASVPLFGHTLPNVWTTWTNLVPTAVTPRHL